MISFFYTIITLFLDNLLNNFLPYTYHYLSLFTPMLVLISLVINYFLIKNKFIYLVLATILGFVTDLLYNSVFLNLYLYLFLALIITSFYYKRSLTIINLLLLTIVVIISYDSLIFFSLVALKYSNLTINDLIYKINNSLITNISYILVSFLILKKSLNKTKEFKLNK